MPASAPHPGDEQLEEAFGHPWPGETFRTTLVGRLAHRAPFLGGSAEHPFQRLVQGLRIAGRQETTVGRIDQLSRGTIEGAALIAKAGRKAGVLR